MPSLHPTEHRGYRELFAFGRSLSTHWGQLDQHLPPTRSRPVREGAQQAQELLRQLETHAAAYDLHGKPAAQGLGSSIGLVRSRVRNRFVETDRATRFALSEIAYVVALLEYLERVARTREDARAQEFCSGWSARMGAVERQARVAAAELGADPDLAMQPYDGSLLGKALQSVGFVVGSVGEWTDRQAAKRG